MPGPISAAGAVTNPTKYAALSMGARQMTGLWTQRSPYRDAAVPYLAAKFYSGSRFDSILDGENREISVDLTDKRSPGSIVFNDNTFPDIKSYYGYQSLQNGVESIRVIADGMDGNIYDATPGQKSTLFSKAAGAGPARFLGINNELFFGDGKEEKKWIYPGSWQASTAIQPGKLINQGAEPGTAYMALGGMSLTILGTSSTGTPDFRVMVYVDPSDLPESFANLVDAKMSFSGLTGATFLNGQTLLVDEIISATLGIFIVEASSGAYAFTPDTGTATTGNGTTGATAPTFLPSYLAVTADSGQQWKSYGSAIENWGMVSPVKAPTLTALNGARWWTPLTQHYFNYSLIDPYQNVQLAQTSVSGNFVTGTSYPAWATSMFQSTSDGDITWMNMGQIGVWRPSFLQPDPSIVLDSNHNLQLCIGSTGAGLTGGTEPTWATVFGDTTTDGDITWMCLDAGAQLTTASVSYGYSWQGIDGTVTTSSSKATILGPIVGTSLTPATPYIDIVGAKSTDEQCGQIWIWRTAQGEPTLILEDQIASDNVYDPPATFSYLERGITDTTANGSPALDAFIPAPVAESQEPPPPGFTGPIYHVQRVWGISGYSVVYSQGPDAIVGNGNTAFAALNEIPYMAQPIMLIPMTVQGGGIVVLTTDGFWIILGTGTPSDPFYTTIYFSSVSISSFTAVDVYQNSAFMMESNGKVSTLAIEYPFNPQTGYNEIGFPIGDQFLKVTTGGLNAALYNPATAYVTWCVANSFDTGMYVADGAVGWFRMGIVNPPESGLCWNTPRQIVGGTSAVQSVKTTPGKYQLLIGPPAGTPGPILVRDATGTVYTDNGVPYPSWDAKGVNQLCPTGKWAEVVHISTKSVAVGARPTVSVLLGEIKPSPKRPYRALKLGDKSNDPARTPRSVSVYSDRYVVKQSGANTLGDCLLTKFDYGTQAVADELLDWGIFAREHDEREEGVAKG
jgi:hypothetical protein